MEYVSFTWIDYTLFSLMIGASGAVGIYFGCYKTQNTTKDYLQGGKTMKVFPVAMSLVGSTLSGVALLGVPAEVYMYGSQYSMMVISIILAAVTAKIAFLPVFYKLQLISINEYLEIRFNKKIRLLTSAMFGFVIVVSLPVTIYAPSLAFNQVTGVNIHIIAVIMSLLCIFYTTLGGLKAVVWADTIQFSATFLTLVVVLILGIISVGGPSIIWEKAKLGDRLDFFNMNPDPTDRSTFWNVILGNYGIWMFYTATSQASIQRFLTLPTYSDANRALAIYISFTVFTKLISCFSGLIMYAKYFDCDPLTAGYMMKPDQILPYYVLEVASNIPGLSGLFISGLFSTALSTLSTYMNSLSCTIYEDFVSPFLSVDISQRKINTILKLITLAIGILVICLIFVVEKLGTVLQLLNSFVGMFSGPIVALFTLGMIFPIANQKGALWGPIVSLCLMSTLIFTNLYLMFVGDIKPIPKPLYTFGCNTTTEFNETTYYNHNNETTTSVPIVSYQVEEKFWLFRISFHYYPFIGGLITIIVGLIVSWATQNKKDPRVNPDLLSPCIYRFISKDSTGYKSVQKEIDAGGAMVSTAT